MQCRGSNYIKEITVRNKLNVFIALICICFTLAACGAAKEQPSPQPDTPSASDAAPKPLETAIDVDLTKLSATMVYSEVYNMMVSLESYVGKTVKMTGQFVYYHDEFSGKYFFAVLIADVTACCQQGLEFVLAGNAVYPDDYPALQAEITVQGVFETYMDGKIRYVHLKDAAIVS